MKKHLLLLLNFLCFLHISISASLAEGNSSWIDRSHAIFLPPQFSTQLGIHQTFPLFWWNFLVLESSPGADSWEDANLLCKKLNQLSPRWVSKTGCQQDLKPLQPILESWAQDYPLRASAPSQQELRSKFDLAMTKASLPVGSSVVGLLRIDPLETYRELQKLLESRMKPKLEKSKGFLFDPSTQRIVIPVQLGFPPSDTAKTMEFKQKIGENCESKQSCDHLFFIGPHSSTVENEKQVTHDVHIVSDTGLVLLALLMGGAIFTRRWKLLLLVIPVLFSTLVSMAATVMIFGSIHGLTLSFGTGIIGLAMDFGLHTAFNQKYTGIWKANAFGLYTTIAALIIMMFSSIPLLRQIMVFSTLGLVSGFIFYYGMNVIFPKLSDIDPYLIHPKNSKWRTGLILFFLLFSVVGFFSLKPNLDLRQFDFQTQRSAETSVWLYRHLGEQVPLLDIYSPSQGESPLPFFHQEKSWASNNQISFESIATYLPTPAIQSANLDSWRKLFCSKRNDVLRPADQKFFEPFLKNLDCAHLTPRLLSDSHFPVPSYLKDFWGSEKWISLWLPSTELDTEKIKAHRPQALSLREIATLFPNTLANELKWMAPVSFFLAVGLLVIYYKRPRQILSALIPFFSGLGLFSLASFLFQFSVSFISLIALVMVFGFSIDFGIFATDLMSFPEKRSTPGVWTALSMSALTTVGGFLPLLFCKHPVLSHLGQALVFGSIGTYLGTIWGVPGLRKFLKVGAPRS
jgi:hypothetical protein